MANNWCVFWITTSPQSHIQERYMQNPWNEPMPDCSSWSGANNFQKPVVTTTTSRKSNRSELHVLTLGVYSISCRLGSIPGGVGFSSTVLTPLTTRHSFGNLCHGNSPVLGLLRGASPKWLDSEKRCPA